ncbi:MAG: glycosyltransferase family protein [Syntrophales bacterium]
MLIVNAVAMLSRKVGDYLYRVEQPSVEMGKTGKATVITVNTLSPWFDELCVSADVLVVHLLSEHDLLPILEERKRQGKPTVYELSDNILALHEGIGIRAWFADPVNLALAMQYLSMADAVQTTGAYLAERFCFVNPRMTVFENQIVRMGTLARKPSDRVVLGWAGSSGHREDIATIRDAVAEALRQCPQLDFAFMGDRDIFATLTGNSAANRFSYTPPGSLDEYFTFLQTLDIGVAPLQDNPYNRCRSDVKFLEYASRGVVPVLSSLAPYRASARDGETALFFDSPAQLSAVLSTLAGDPDLRRRVREAAYRYVQDNRTEKGNVGNRLAFYSGLIGKGTDTPVPSGVSLTPCDEGTSCFDAAVSETETLIREGINEEIVGADEKALRAYKKAGEAAPEFSLPRFWLGYFHYRRNEPAAVRWFDDAVKRNPRSLRARWLKAKCIQGTDPEQAMNELLAAIKPYPAYTPALVSLGELLEAHHIDVEALRWYDDAMRINPFFSSAALGMGRIYEKQGEREKAGSALGTAADLAPLWAEAQYRMALFCFSNNDTLQAMAFCARALAADVTHAATRELIDEIERTSIPQHPTQH